MSELVQIAPGVVFSSDVLGAEWVHKYRPGDGEAASADHLSRSVKECRPEVHVSMPGQLSLL
ncbi:hypothetical protein [Burkholderia sp. 22313]|uniref:hypothetical protein n=1 Tax=Burkholderia sp. 22313 TaxID=3453908 RepID=UPI002C97767A|nr:hypothetical protein [Burkholderia sp.]